MRLSNIFNKDQKPPSQKLRNLEKKLVQLGQEPVILKPSNYQKCEDHLIQKIQEIPNLQLLSVKLDSKTPKFLAFDRENVQLADTLYQEAFHEIFNTEETQKNELPLEKSGSQNDQSPKNIYLQSNVPKTDLHPNEKSICFLNKTKFMPSFDSFLPLKIEKTVYDSFALTVYVDRERTGFEDSKDFPIVIGSLIAGRYRVMEFLGAASFAKCVHVKDLKRNLHCCLKIIENNKDFIDQSIDEIKLLR